MHDIRAIRADPAGFDGAMASRGLGPQSEAILALDAGRRTTLGLLQEKQAKRNELSRDIGRSKREGGVTDDLEAQAISLRVEMELLQSQADERDAQIKAVLEALPNILAGDVPAGRDESANVVLKIWGEPLTFDFTPRQHFELGEALGLMDFASAAKLAGARFTVLRGSQLPKFAEDLFRTTDGRWLIPTAEVPLTNMAAGEITPVARLPWRMTALTDCFRSEAGSAGRDTRGMLRQHQFRKVEMVSITHPDASADEHERMTRCAETVLERLGLPYRRMLLCAGDTGFGAAKTFDLEVWLPGQGAWREISSCSNMRDFQARRMNARFRAADGKTLGFVHTLNGSGLAVGRALIAVMETYQRADGSITVPEALGPYMGGIERIGG